MNASAETGSWIGLIRYLTIMFVSVTGDPCVCVCACVVGFWGLFVYCFFGGCLLVLLLLLVYCVYYITHTHTHTHTRSSRKMYSTEPLADQ